MIEPEAPIDWRRNQVAVTVATFIGFAGFTLVMPFLPLYFEQLGVHDPGDVAIWSGISLGVTPAITAAMAPAWGRVADRYGRKLMVVRSLGCFIVTMVALAYVRHPWQVLTLRAILGFFAGYGPLAMTMAAESAPAEHMAMALGWVQTAQRLGPALGPVIGGVLAQAVGLRRAFLVAAAFYVCALLLVAVGYRDVPARTARPDMEPAEPLSFRRVRLVPHFLLFMGMVFGLQMVDRSFGPVLPLYLREIGTAATRVPFMSGVILTTAAASAAIGNQLSSWLLRRMSAAQLVPRMALVAAAAATVFGAGSNSDVLVASSVLFGFAIGVATTSLYTLAGHSVPRGSRGAAFGYLSTAYLTGLAVSPVVAGFIGARSMRAVFFVDAVGLAALALSFLRRMSGGGSDATPAD